MISSVQSTRVFIVDDHRIVRMGLRTLLEQTGAFAVIGEAASGEEALEQIPQSRSNLVIVDISLKEMNGVELTRRLKREYPDVRVLIVSMHNEIYYVRQAIEAGADGYVLKDNVDNVIVEAAQAVLDGRRYLCKDVEHKLER